MTQIRLASLTFSLGLHSTWGHCSADGMAGWHRRGIALVMERGNHIRVWRIPTTPRTYYGKQVTS